MDFAVGLDGRRIWMKHPYAALFCALRRAAGGGAATPLFPAAVRLNLSVKDLR